ncbi:MAG: hypothetical protein ACLSHU_13325 [Oscillospiraceae bacterium]
MEYGQIFSTASSPKIAAVVSYLFLTPQDPMAISQRAFDMSSCLKKYTGADRFVAVTSLERNRLRGPEWRDPPGGAVPCYGQCRCPMRN